jgi:hypothetical protein
MEIQDSLSVVVTSLVERARKGDSFTTFLCVAILNHACVLCNLPTQDIRPMFLGHVLDFEKIEEILEGFIICHGMMFL